MATATQKKQQGRVRRHKRVRKNLTGTAERPRLSVFRSNKHMVAQLIDDTSGRTLVTASSHEKGATGATGNVATSSAIGQRIAERAKSAGITKVVFDRGGFLYHGRIAAVAEAARAAGLEF